MIIIDLQCPVNQDEIVTPEKRTTVVLFFILEHRAELLQRQDAVLTIGRSRVGIPAESFSERSIA